LGIRHVGEEVARVLAQWFGSLDGLLAADWEDILVAKAAAQKTNARARPRGEALVEVPLEGVGPEIVAALRAFLGESHNRDVMTQLLAAGVDPSPPQRTRASVAFTGVRSPGHPSEPAAQGALAGRTIVVTGTLAGISRPEAEDLIRQHGGTASGSVSRRTHFVLAGADAGSKLAKATELGIPVIDLETLMRMIQTHDDTHS